MKATGTYITTSTVGEKVKAFVPNPLPPKPAIELTDKDQKLLGRANVALGQLDAVASLLPDISLFLYFYVRKEAVLSSQIEGTQSSFSDLLLHEESLAPGVPLDDVQEVSNYVAAMNHGLKRLQKDNWGLPAACWKSCDTTPSRRFQTPRKSLRSQRQPPGWPLRA